MLTYIKFGGSIITDKQGREAADDAQIAALCADLATAYRELPQRRWLLGHGSGSFGHTYAARYGIHRGLGPSDDWRGFAETSAAALRLNRIVLEALISAQIPAVTFQPSASLQTSGGQVVSWATTNLATALSHALVPLIHGDVAFDQQQGSAIASTESLFSYLASQPALAPQRIVLVGEEAVFTADPRLDPMAEPIAEINRHNLSEVLSGAGGSHGIDVTGGMRSKIESMWALVEQHHDLEVRLVGAHQFAAALRDAPLSLGTLIRWG